ncbi:hypothetical protein scyTo_0017574 [Scyliorhinus torazame]|uniref:Sema domain-containing protein n=1 Tax=Scyliorhinus torazame TaxID=75743 RepID=A0A401PVP5_SCYTO|nr:hypothetical protein [Scyliorhinus torazame]
MLKYIIQAQCKFTSTEEYSTTLRDGSTIYVGGKEILYEINLGKPCILKIKVPINCDFFQQFDKKFDSMINGRSRPLGNGVCPFTPKHGFASLVEDERLYSVAPLYEKGEGKLLRGYKKSSTAQWLLSIDNWLQDPHFVGMSAMDDQVFMFFREKYLPTNLDIDPWISRIARVCKDDLGGSSQRLQSKWATFLKARLLCNIPADHVHFNTIQNVFVARSKNSDARVYGIFSSNWNGTAICSYSMEDINKVFGTSKFKGFAEAIPDPRPGTCGTDTQNLRDKVLNVVENHPEMKTDVHPIGNHPLVMDMEKVFQLIVVDSVVAVNGKVSRVLFLTMGRSRQLMVCLEDICHCK